MESPSLFSNVTDTWLGRLFTRHGWDPARPFEFKRSDENRVIWLRGEKDSQAVVIKLFRPQRRTLTELREQHAFLNRLHAADVPVIRPIHPDVRHAIRSYDGIRYMEFHPVEGSEVSGKQYSSEDLRHTGRLLAELHRIGRPAVGNVGVRSPVSLGEATLEYLSARQIIPESLRGNVERAARSLFAKLRRLTAGTATQRIHGDFGPWNIRWNQNGPVYLDFDDMSQGLAIQDIALFCNDLEDDRSVQTFLEGYAEREALPRETFNLFKPLRSLRTLHVAAWIVSLWNEPGIRLRHADIMTEAGWERRLAEIVEGSR